MSEDDTDIETVTDESTAIAIPMLGMKLAELDLRIRTAIDGIEAMSGDEAVAMRNAVRSLASLARKWGPMADDALRDWLTAHGEPGKPAEVAMGTVRYYVGTPKKTVQKVDHAAMLDALLTHFMGDTSQVVLCLSSNAWKHGQIGKLLGDAAKDLFTVEYDDELKEGKPNKRLVAVDTAFQR